MVGRGSSEIARPRSGSPDAPRRQATRTMSCSLMARGTPLKTTRAKQAIRPIPRGHRPEARRESTAYYNLGAALCNSGHFVEVAQRFLEAKERYPVGSELWAEATAVAFDALRQGVCDEVAKPEWWNDEELKALSARILRAAPNEEAALDMRANVLSGVSGGTWEAGPRSAAELKEAATCFYRSAALCDAPALKAEIASSADWCRVRAAVVSVCLSGSLWVGKSSDWVAVLECGHFQLVRGSTDDTHDTTSQPTHGGGSVLGS